MGLMKTIKRKRDSSYWASYAWDFALGVAAAATVPLVLYIVMHFLPESNYPEGSHLLSCVWGYACADSACMGTWGPVLLNQMSSHAIDVTDQHQPQFVLTGVDPHHPADNDTNYPTF